MTRMIGPREAEALVASEDVDVVDVREPNEFDDGHLPRARNVPLGTLKSKPKSHLPEDEKKKVLFVCARGMRSMTAAEIAESAGRTEIYSLEGGTAAWRDAGLPIEGKVESKSTSGTKTEATTAKPHDPLCGLPEPGLDVVVGANMRKLRTDRGMSLDALAAATGLSRTLLGQIELGKTPPSVSIVWRIATAFDVPFSAMLATDERRAQTTVLRAEGAKRIESPDGRFASRALYLLSEKPAAEFYELYLAPHSREDAAAHQRGTRENLVVVTGRCEITIAGERHDLGKGDAIVFMADVPHAYVNPGNEPCWIHLVMTYGNVASDTTD
jgi:rhodanese-related sulfurtransferase/transcriptional regulator with XRE-family HTH domain